MRLAFVHGINNENETPASIERVWWDALVRGWYAAGLPPKQRPDIVVGYYADGRVVNLVGIADGGYLQW